jgi:hypothetical protein
MDRHNARSEKMIYKVRRVQGFTLACVLLVVSAVGGTVK